MQYTLRNIHIKFVLINEVVSEEKSFEIVNENVDDGRKAMAIAHTALWAR